MNLCGKFIINKFQIPIGRSISRSSLASATPDQAPSFHSVIPVTLGVRMAFLSTYSGFHGNELDRHRIEVRYQD